jgi:AAA15 family ATPase/GTPase
MLLQFAVENFACFADEVLFSMVASPGTEHPRHVVQSETGRKPRVLRVAALYGANAHGKTKLVEALRFARRLVVQGTRSGTGIPRDAFRLDRERIQQPSRFDFVIDYRGVEYSYGFSVDGERVHEEWLFARPSARELRYFERLTDAQGRVRVEFGPELVGRSTRQRQFMEFVAQGTRPNQLFLTEAMDRNVEKLRPLFEWFKDVLTIVAAEGLPQPLGVRVGEEREFVDFMADFLRRSGTGIEGLTAQEEPLDAEMHLSDVPDALREDIEAAIARDLVVGFRQSDGPSLTFYRTDDGVPMMARLKTLHLGKDGTRVDFDFEDESSGTQRLMEILPILADSASSERVYVIDELDRRLHPLLSRLFVQSFINRCGDAQRAQLIFTTHDTHLMDLELLRRDEVWFFEKDQYGASRLYSLNDLKVRPDLKIEKSYLNGRFGGIPLIQEPAAGSDRPC